MKKVDLAFRAANFSLDRGNAGRRFVGYDLLGVHAYPIIASGFPLRRRNIWNIPIIPHLHSDRKMPELSRDNAKPLKEARQAAGLTQREAGLAIGCSQGEYSKLESGQRHLDNEEIGRLCRLIQEAGAHHTPRHNRVEWRRTMRELIKFGRQNPERLNAALVISLNLMRMGAK